MIAMIAGHSGGCKGARARERGKRKKGEPSIFFLYDGISVALSVDDYTVSRGQHTRSQREEKRALLVLPSDASWCLIRISNSRSVDHATSAIGDPTRVELGFRGERLIETVYS